MSDDCQYTPHECPNCGSDNVRAVPDAQPGMLHCVCVDCEEVWRCEAPTAPFVGAA